MDYDKVKVGKRDEAAKKPSEGRPFDPEQDRMRSEEWRPSDAKSSPTRVGSATTPEPSHKPRS